jgi:phosphohistidine phosphatase
MHIYLLRHGVAADAGPGLADHDRALTDDGWKRLRRAAPAWRKLVAPPQVVLVSPLRRAQETAQVFTEAVQFRGELRTDQALVPTAAPSLALNLLEIESLSQVQSVALVGHEPHLGYLLGTLLTGHPRQPVPLKKGMLVGVETESTASLIATLRFVLSSKCAGELA